MSRKAVSPVLLVLLAVTMVFITTGCDKLKYDYLVANHHFSNANHHFTEQKFRLAIEEYEKALEKNPSLVQAYRFLGEAYKQLYKPGVENETNAARAQSALEALTKAYDIEPDNKQIIHSLGDMYDKMRDFENAETLFLKILEMEPTNMDNYYVVANFYKRYAGENEELAEKALSMYLRRIETDPLNPQGYAYLAQYYDEKTPQPDFDAAVEVHEMRLKLEPDNYLIYYAIGVNRFWKAFRLQNVLKWDVKNTLAQESEAALKKSLDLEPAHSFTYSYINLVYRNVFSKLYPEKEQYYVQQADSWLDRFKEVRKRELEREKLEKELQRGETGTGHGTD